MELHTETQQVFLLPDDVYIEIISRVECLQTTSSCSVVCKRWNLFLSSPKVLRNLFQLRWDPNHIHFDYSSIDIFGKQQDDNRTWLDRHRSLEARVAKLVGSKDAHRIWGLPFDSAHELKFWFLQPETDKLQLCWTNKIEQQLILATLGRDSGSQVSEHSRHDISHGTLSKFSRYLCWNTDEETQYFLDAATMLVSRRPFSGSLPFASFCHKEVCYSSKPFGVFEQGRYQQQGIQVSRGGSLPWTSKIPCNDCVIFAATKNVVLVAEFHRASSKIIITSMDASTGSVISSIVFDSCDIPYDYHKADCHFVNPHQVAVIFPTFIALVDISLEGRLSLEDMYSHHGDVLITSTFGYSLLVVETHPQQHFFGRVSSSILVFQILLNKIRLLRVWEDAPSCDCLAIDGNLDIYMAETNTGRVLAKFSLCANNRK